AELPIILVLLPQVGPVSTIFLIVVYVVVMAVPIVVPLFLMVVRRHRDRSNEGHAQQKSAQNQKMLHNCESSSVLIRQVASRSLKEIAQSLKADGQRGV